MNDEGIRVPRRLVVGVDGSPGSLSALEWAVSLAGAVDGSVRAVMAWHYPYLATMPGMVGAVPPVGEMEKASVEALDKVLAGLHTDVTVESVVAQGSASQVLVDAAAGEDLVVVGRRERPGLRGLGSTSRHVAIHAPSSVAVIPPDTAPLPAEPAVAVAVDGSPRSIDALVWAARLFPSYGSLAALHSHDEQMLDYHDLPAEVRSGLRERATQRLDQAVDRALVRLDRPVDIDTHVYEGDPRTSLLDAIWGMDVLVVGDRGHSGVRGLLLGSFATFAVGHCDLPVIVARR